MGPARYRYMKRSQGYRKSLSSYELARDYMDAQSVRYAVAAPVLTSGSPGLCMMLQ